MGLVKIDHFFRLGEAPGILLLGDWLHPPINQRFPSSIPGLNRPAGAPARHSLPWEAPRNCHACEEPQAHSSWCSSLFFTKTSSQWLLKIEMLPAREKGNYFPCVFLDFGHRVGQFS